MDVALQNKLSTAHAHIAQAIAIIAALPDDVRLMYAVNALNDASNKLLNYSHITDMFPEG